VLRRAIGRSPNNPEAHFARGGAYQGLDRMPLAIESYQEALRLDPGHSGARLKLRQAGIGSPSPVAVATPPDPSIPVPILED